MAYIVMASIGMPFIVMGDIVMSDVVMAYRVMANVANKTLVRYVVCSLLLCRDIGESSRLGMGWQTPHRCRRRSALTCASS